MDKSGRNSSERGENSCGGAMLHVPLGLKQMTSSLPRNVLDKVIPDLHQINFGEWNL